MAAVEEGGGLDGRPGVVYRRRARNNVCARVWWPLRVGGHTIRLWYYCDMCLLLRSNGSCLQCSFYTVAAAETRCRRGRFACASSDGLVAGGRRRNGAG